MSHIYKISSTKSKCNTFTEDVESSVFGKSMTDHFLKNYNLEELSQMSLEDLADYLRFKGRNRFDDAILGTP